MQLNGSSKKLRGTRARCWVLQARAPKEALEKSTGKFVSNFSSVIKKWSLNFYWNITQPTVRAAGFLD